MKNKFLLIDKKQRVKIKNKYPHAVTRVMAELDKLDVEYDFVYNRDLAVAYNNGEIIITARDEDILNYTHIMFRGHFLENNRTYQIKRMVVDHIDHHNKKHPEKQIKVHNAEAFKNFQYYNKVYTFQLCAYNDIPYFDSYYRLDGKYKKHQGHISFPLIIKEYAGVNDIRMIDGKRKVKKNVYKVEKPEDFNQKHLKDKDKKDFYLQEFTEQAMDLRTFVARVNGMHKLIGGFKRAATKGFMTVNKGRYTLYNNPSDDIADISLKFAKIVNADFIAVDYMFKDEKPYLQEISLNPGFKAYETKTVSDDGDKPVNIPKFMIESFI